MAPTPKTHRIGTIPDLTERYSSLPTMGTPRRQGLCSHIVVEGGYPRWRPLPFMAFCILHDVLCEGNVVCNSS